MSRKRAAAGNRDGINVYDVWAAKGARKGKRWLYRVWDARARKYKRRAFADGSDDKNRKDPGCAEGDSWAKKEHARLTLGQTTANRAEMGVVAEDYLTELRERKAGKATIRNVELTVQKLGEAGIRNLSDEGLRAKVSRWLGTLPVSRSKAADPDDEDAEIVAAASTTARYLCHVRALVNHGRRRGWIVGDPLQNLRVQVPETNREVFTIEELRRLLALKATQDPAWLFAVLMCYTGQRREEACASEWQRIDWKARVLPVDKGKGRGGGKRRTIYLMDEAYALLSSIGGPDAKTPHVGRIVPCKTKSGITWAQFRAVLGRAKIDADRGVDKITGMPRRLSPHSCRHTFAALWLASDGDSVDLRRMLGHSADDLTEYYSQQVDLYRRQVRAEGWARGQFRLATASAALSKAK